MSEQVTKEFLDRRILHDPDTGILRWKARTPDMFRDPNSCARWNTRHAGMEAFATVSDKGYKVGSIGGVTLRSHRVVWMMHYGEWPKDQIDHEDHDRTNNRINNLSQVSNPMNQRNKGVAKNNTSGVNGVYWNKETNRWYSCIQVGGKQRYLGQFGCKMAAAIVRKAADSAVGFHENHGVKS